MFAVILTVLTASLIRCVPAPVVRTSVTEHELCPVQLIGTVALADEVVMCPTFT
jgi:hypothetical protein